MLRILKTTWRTDILLVLTCVTVYYLHAYMVPKAIQIPATIATLLGTAIAFFVGFSNNQAYDRWWEARIIWGALVNDSRSWARNVVSYIASETMPHEELQSIKKKLVYRQISFVYALKANLRGKPDGYFEKYLLPEEVDTVRKESNIANAILTLNARDVHELSQARLIDEFRFIQLNEMITAFTDHMGKSERIRNTVFPTSYIYFTRLFIWLFVILSTLILANPLGGWSILIGWSIGFVFHVTHQNGMALMDPFDEISTGIPLNQISRTIEINLLQMLGEAEVPEPIAPINDEYVL